MFNPDLSGLEYAALTPEQQRQWDRDLLDYWCGRYQQKCTEDFHADSKVIAQEQWGGQTQGKQSS